MLGFVKQYRDQIPGIQFQIDLALHEAAAAKNAHGTSLMLWLGADPHAKTPADPYVSDIPELRSTAFAEALWSDDPKLLAGMLKRPIPREQVQYLFGIVAHHTRPDIVRRLLKEGADPNDPGEEGYPVLHSYISPLIWRYSARTDDQIQRGLEALELVLQAGAKWSPDDRQIRHLRRDLAGGSSKAVIPLVALLQKYRAFPEAALAEMTRTPSVRKVLNGFSRPRQDRFDFPISQPTYSAASEPAPTPPRRGYWKRHWSQR